MISIRRRPHLVDFWTPRVAGVDEYRLQWAAEPEGPAATIITSTNAGFLDDNVNRNVVDVQSLGDQVRIVFDPSTYSIPDDAPFWLQFVPVTGGVEGTPGPMMLAAFPDVLEAVAESLKGTQLAGTPDAVAAGGEQLHHLPGVATNQDAGPANADDAGSIDAVGFHGAGLGSLQPVGSLGLAARSDHVASEPTSAAKGRADARLSAIKKALTKFFGGD